MIIRSKYYPRFGVQCASLYGIRCKWEVPAASRPAAAQTRDEAFMAPALQSGALVGVTGLAKYQPEWNGV